MRVSLSNCVIVIYFYFLYFFTDRFCLMATDRSLLFCRLQKQKSNTHMSQVLDASNMQVLRIRSVQRSKPSQTCPPAFYCDRCSHWLHHTHHLPDTGAGFLQMAEANPNHILQLQLISVLHTKYPATARPSKPVKLARSRAADLWWWVIFNSDCGHHLRHRDHHHHRYCPP